MRGTGSTRWNALRVTTRKAPPTFSTAGRPRDEVLAVRKTFPISRPIVGLHADHLAPGQPLRLAAARPSMLRWRPGWARLAVTDDAAMSTNRDDLLDLSGLAA